MTDLTELASLDAMAQAELVRRRELSSTELLVAAIARVETVNPAINAVFVEEVGAPPGRLRIAFSSRTIRGAVPSGVADRGRASMGAAPPAGLGGLIRAITQARALRLPLHTNYRGTLS